MQKFWWLLPSNKKRDLRPIQNIYHSTVRKINHKWKTFRTAGNIPRNGCPNKFTSRSDCVMLYEIAKNTTATFQTLQASVSILNVKVYESTIRKRLNKYSFLKGLSKKQHSLGLQSCIQINHKTGISCKHIGSGLMIWACFAATGPGHLSVKYEQLCI